MNAIKKAAGLEMPIMPPAALYPQKRLVQFAIACRLPFYLGLLILPAITKNLPIEN
ncbi:hypothetical protein ACWA5Z_09025 [Testudinibacter sp. P80/BLE/0925]|uniref:hypothetical protein n=1 Tax=Testudinibacter sp. TW-1 TaxID=3417757 RepID=UPI003D35C2F7